MDKKKLVTAVECIIPNESAPLCPKGSDAVFVVLAGMWRDEGEGQDNERIEEEEQGYSTLVPSDLALMRFNTRAIITRYRYNGVALFSVSVFYMHARARAKLFVYRQFQNCRH